ncbi:hypothetical protein [Methylobacter sp.]|uniref:hypothetical protein n=1 Tax=Methylobacter sp. TaxID=2051955 RepID=UPI002FDE8906
MSLIKARNQQKLVPAGLEFCFRGLSPTHHLAESFDTTTAKTLSISNFPLGRDR